MSVATLSPTAEFVKLGYGDLHDLSVRSLDFQTEGIGQFETAAECLRVIDRYNAFDAEKVIPALQHVWPALSSVKIGRESSPVLYAYVPHWTHQRHDWAGSGMGESYGFDDMAAIALAFFGAMAGAHADEISVMGPNGHLFFETYQPLTDEPPTLVRGPQTIVKLGDEKPYCLRVWWD